MQFTNSSHLMRLTFRKVTILYKTQLYSFKRNKYVSSETVRRSDPSFKMDLSNLSHNTILISESRDIYENLAFEDWLYNNINFATKDIYILLMWYNSPSVVIGRHQNPWTECSLDFCQASGISIARRNSGGGTVYHDYGNLNCSFMTPKPKYNRKNNLQLICDAIRKNWNINLTINDRDDILMDGKYKISGTAAKLGRTNAYHHCTILINADEMKMKQALHRELFSVESRATSSTRAAVKNLNSQHSNINIDSIVERIKEHYKLVYSVPEGNIFRLDPSENICLGITSILEQLKSWKWCFGHTPRFMVTRNFPLCPSFSKWEVKKLPPDLEIKLLLNKGVIESISFNPQILESSNLDALNHCIIGREFSPQIEKSLQRWITFCNDEILCKFIKSCVLQLILDLYR